MDITKRGWKCDICGKEIFDGDCGWNAKFKVVISSNSSLNCDACGTYEDVCSNCVSEINSMIEA